MSPAVTLIEKVSNIFASEAETAERLYRRAVEGGNVKAEDLAAAMKTLGKSPGALALEQNEFAERKRLAEIVKSIVGLQEAVDRHGAAQCKAIRDYQAAGLVLQETLAEERRLESLAAAELKAALDAKAKLIAGRPEHAARIVELRDNIGRAKCRLSDLRDAIAAAESGLAFCRDAMKHPARPLDQKTIGMANLLFGSSLPIGDYAPSITVTISAERVEQTFNSLTISLADNKTEQARLQEAVKAGEKELAELERLQLQP